MVASENETLVIPYGVPADRAGSVAARLLSDDEDRPAGPVPLVKVDRRARRMLRWNGGQYAFPEPPDLRKMTEPTAQLAYLSDHLKHFCDLWERAPKLFLDRYAEFVAARVEAGKGPLTRSLAQFGNLYGYRDWMLSAPRPLPRALVASLEGAYYPVDFAFWLGDRLLAVLLVGSGTPTRQAQERALALADSGVEIAALSVEALMRGGAAYLASGVLPTEFDAFWAGELLPSSPFKGASLGEIVRE